jgi:phosphoribosyl 1,2-cyclic phosphodiesterase/CheY-like chemotaxis protein
VSLEAGGHVFVFDCGTGVRPLGNHLMQQGLNGRDVNLFISHAHWDHIQGFPFFTPLFVPGTTCNVFAPQEQNQRLKDTLAGQMQYRYFPVELDHLSAAIRYQELREGSLSIGDVRISCRYLNHTTVTMAYRLEYAGRTFVYATDTEPFAQRERAWSDPERRRFWHRQDEELAHFFAGADVIVMDSQYRPEEYAAKVTWGHGTYDYALDMAMTAGAKSLALYHHDPMRNDLAVEGILQACWRRVAGEGSTLVVAAAAEGMTMSLEDLPSATLEPSPAALPQFRHQIHVALVGVDDDVLALTQKALTEQHYVLGQFDHLTALATAELGEYRPHLVLLQPRERGEAQHIKRHLQELGRHYSELPILVVLPEGRQADAEDAFEAGASDVIGRPFTFSQLRARVDSWLFRGGIAVDRRSRARTEAADPRPAVAAAS